MRKLVLTAVILIFAVASFADEGMWTMDQLSLLRLNEKGLEIPVEAIYTPDGDCLLDAIVLLGGGTSEFVSPKGLMLTNHHVAFGAVQRASTQGTDYLTDGFLANSLEEEIQAPGVNAQIIQEIRDVTSEVLKAGDGIEGLVERDRAINAKIQEIEDQIEADAEDINANIAAMYNGKSYILYVYKRFDDVRIVYMPPMAIGNYGGDIDNWMWPRHTGDFAFARVYVSPDGVGRKYHPENVPYEPKTWLKISNSDLDDGDFTFVLGYPGTTTRYRTSHSAKFWETLFLPGQIQLFKDIIAILEMAGEDSPEAKMKVAGLDKGLNNYLKKYGGMLEAMEKYDFLANRQKEDQALDTFIKEKRKTRKKYGNVLKEIEKAYAENIDRTERDNVLGLFGFLSGLLPRNAIEAYGTVMEREKPAEDRDPNFSEKAVERRIENLHFRYLSYYEPAEKMRLKYALEKANDLPEGQRIKGLEYILSDIDKSMDEYIDEMFANTKLSDVDFTRSLYEMNSEEINALNDPMMNFAINLYTDNEELNDYNEKFGAEINHLRKLYNEAMLLQKGGVVYPDANRTVRFAFGPVIGYSPRDAVDYAPFTSLSGVIDKDTGEDPFNMPEKLKELYHSKDFGQWVDPDLNDVPVAFLHDGETTNGSSGSPVLNARGEMIGIVFDGNIEAMLNDWKYYPEIQRTISVDIRYVMFITEKYAGADYLLEEVGLK
jgi:hypothetical protein